MSTHSTGRTDEKGKQFSDVVLMLFWWEEAGSWPCGGYNRGNERVRKQYRRSPEARGIGTYMKKIQVGLQGGGLSGRKD